MMKGVFIIFVLSVFACEAQTNNGSFVPPTFSHWKALQSLRQSQLPSLQELNTVLAEIFHSQEFKDIFTDPETFESLAVTYNISEKCVNMTEFAISSGGNWTKNMIDATGKPPSALLQGAFHWIGGFQQCMDNPPPKNYSGPGDPPRSHYCRQTWGDPSFSPLSPSSFSIDIGLCVPEACTERDIDIFTYRVMYMLKKYFNTPTVKNYAQCYVRRTEMEYSGAAVIMICICVIFGVVMLCGTFYDIFLQHRVANKDQQLIINKRARESNNGTANGGSNVRYDNMYEEEDEENPTPAPIVEPKQVPLRTWEKMLIAFSVYTNAIKILDAKQQPGRLSCLDGIRFLSMSWVILGHTYFFSAAYVNNLAAFFPVLQSFTYQAIMNATFSVDSFFVLSGLLTAYMFLKEATKMGTLANVKFWILYFLHRFWRLTPPYMLFLGFYTALLKYMNNGPMWNQTFGLDGPNCNSNWWYNLLYINNFLDPNKGCMGWAWYLANDMQFHYFVASIILPVTFLFGKAGAIVSTTVFLLISIVSTGVISSVNNINVDLAGNGFNFIYEKPWCRVGAYVIGIFTGYLITEHQKKPFRLPKVAVALGWFLATAICLSVLYGLAGVNHGDYRLTENVAALYNALSRVSWSLGLSWLIFACLTDHGGWVNRFLSWPAFIPLSRLTYSAYLVHPVVMIFIYGSSLQSYMVSEFSAIYWFFGNMVAAYLIAFILSLTWESPLIGLERILLRK